MTFSESKIPDFLTDRRNTIRQIVFTAVFALIFINIYSPFGVNTWYNVTKPQLFLYSSLVILTGLLVIALSRIIMLRVVRKRQLSTGSYIGWIAMEIVSLAIVYLVLRMIFVSEIDDIVEAFKDSLEITSLVLLFPYTLTFLYFSWQEKNRKLAELSGNGMVQRPTLAVMIPFRDERGELRFSVKTSDLLYLESADNYVIIHYIDGAKRSKYLIRNTLKYLEKELQGVNVLRCHRSFIVNFDRVKIVRKEKDGFVLELDLPDKQALPISLTYVDEVMKLFSAPFNV
ncbi:MAG TPA: LytTR family DNA-binding domain-containing protein [Bacteroidales bacterium]|nr:LytTR family DNA-binding domain-containing protein [Bacteroidales bacterium]